MQDLDSGIKSAITIINDHVSHYPKDKFTIVTELLSICNKFDPDIQSKKKNPYLLVDSKFADECDNILNKIKKIVGEDIRIPELRYHADDLSKTYKIPLSNSTRKHKETLLKWFDIHWDTLEPSIREWKTK